jgi:Peptidase S46
MPRTDKFRFLLLAPIAFAALLFAVLPPLLADEGMWTFDNPPTQILQQKYGFAPTREWLDHVRLSSARFNDGGSGSFVSPHGLVLTNHHVALGQLQKVSTPQKDYVADGFLAKTQAEELKCPDLEVDVLMSSEDVTSRVLGSVKPGMNDADALKARKAEIAKIERESLDATGLRSDVISLYGGGQYWLYRYKKYTDLRLVFAPEQQIAFFGGDPDNFTYPRYDLDLALFRVYENGKPIDSPNYLKWSDHGSAAGDLVFVSGNPGSTSRLETMAEVEFDRDDYIPLILKLLNRRIDVLQRYSAQGPEQAREALDQTFGLQNSLKLYKGQYEGLQRKDLIAARQKQEDDFRARVDANAEWKKEYGGAWEQIAKAETEAVTRIKQRFFWSLSASTTANRALAIVQYVTEVKKPDGERLDGFHDSQLDSLRFRLLSPAPVYPEMEEALLADALHQATEELGPSDPFVTTVLQGRSPEQTVQALFATTKMADPAFRKSLLDGGEAAVAQSTDPMIVLARRVDPLARELHKWNEDHVESVVTPAYEKIGKARFAVYGTSTYPDATFTLRLAFGTVKGYPMNGTEAPPYTTFFGLYDRSDGFSDKPPFDLPQRYVDGKNKIDLATPLNFVNTCDITGGNSGSPVINRAGELVGLIFDGNIESLVNDYIYDETTARAVAVDTRAMTGAMRNLYGAGFIVDEIQGKPAQP